jgi:hypothetical protein
MTGQSKDEIAKAVNGAVSESLVEELSQAAATMPQGQFDDYLARQLEMIRKNKGQLFGNLKSAEYENLINEVIAKQVKQAQEVNVRLAKAYMEGGHDASTVFATVDDKAYKTLFQNPYARFGDNPLQTGKAWVDKPGNFILNWHGLGVGGTGQRGLALNRTYNNASTSIVPQISSLTEPALEGS